MSDSNVIQFNSKNVFAQNKVEDISEVAKRLSIEVVNRRLYDLQNTVMFLIQENKKLLTHIDSLVDSNILLANNLSGQEKRIQDIVGVISKLKDIVIARHG